MSFSIASDDVWNDDWYSVDEQGEWRGVSFEDLECTSSSNPSESITTSVCSGEQRSNELEVFEIQNTSDTYWKTDVRFGRMTSAPGSSVRKTQRWVWVVVSTQCSVPNSGRTGHGQRCSRVAIYDQD